MDNEYNVSDIKSRILFEIEKRGLKAYKMLPEIGLSKNTLDNSNKSMPKADTLAKIADALDTSTDYLLGRTDQPDMQATITVGNITGDNNANLSINNTDCDQFMKEFYRIISQMDFRQRTELMLMIYNYIDNKKSR